MKVERSDVRMVLLEEDDYMHPIEEASNFNESAYYNFINHKNPVLGGWIRIGNRPNEGYAEVTVVTWEPGGTLGFMFQRPEIKDNRAHDAGGARFEILESWKDHRVTYRGDACVMKNPVDLCNPGRAFKSNPIERVEIDVRWRGISPGWGGEERRQLPDGTWEAVGKNDPDKQFARGHFEQLGAAEGVMVVAGRRYDLTGFGLRDHSWGPRYWQNTGPYKWLTMNFGDDMGMMGAHIEVPGEGVRTFGFVWEKEKGLREIGKVEVETEYAGPEKIHDRVYARLWPEDGDEPFEVTGRVLSIAPCRNRRGGWVTRITEALTEWKVGNRTGYGISEYLTHLQKGE